MKYRILLLIPLFFCSMLQAEVSRKKPKKLYQTFSSGIFLNIDMAQSNYQQPNFFVRSKSPMSIRPGVGLHASYGFHKRMFVTITGGYTTTSFNFKFSDVNGEPRMTKAEMGFYQGKGNINFVLNPGSYNSFFYIGAGAQALQRVYTKEQYINEAIDNTVWPKTSIFPEFILGYRNYFSNQTYIQPTMTFRFQPQKTLIYDRTLNQISFGAVIGGDIRQMFKRGPKQDKSKIIDLK